MNTSSAGAYRFVTWVLMLGLAAGGVWWVSGRVYAALFPEQHAALQAQTARAAGRARQLADQEAQKARVEQDALEAENTREQAKAEVDEVRWRFARHSLDLYRQSLFDPYGAQFRDVWMIQLEDGGVGVCGVVNAKNRLGAYIGEQPFIAMGDLSWTPDHPNFEAHFQNICLDGRKVEQLRT